MTPLRRLARLRLLAAGWLFATLALAWAAAADPPKTRFRLPEGDAAVTLRQFSQQARTPIVYPVDAVSGVKTNAVHGDFTAREALDRMVAGTGLIASQDAGTGALTVGRAARPPAPAPRTAPLAPSSENSPSLPPMPPKQTSSLSRMAASLAALLLPSASAQAADSAAKSAADETVVLSPFAVNSEKDHGYQATNTLAGTRLNTPIRDLGASISVYTREFLNDIGATTANELLIYATGMEAAGPGGNFSNAAGASITEPNVVGDGIRNNPQGGTRARGLTTPTFTRGYFISDVGIDGYNTSAVTVNRGPNAILFGVANAAGVVDTTLLRADLRRNLNRVEFRYGDNDSMRSTLDLNRVLIPRKLGARIALLNDEERFDQRPAFETKKRFYGTLTFEPTRSTVIRGNVEAGRTRANRPFSVLPFNSFQTWLDQGRQPWDWTFYDDPARNPLATTQNAGGNIPGSVPATPFRTFALNNIQTFNTLVWPLADTSSRGGVLGLGYRATPSASNSTGAGALAVNTVRSQVFDPVFNRDSTGDTQSWLETVNIGELPALYYATTQFPAGRIPAGRKTQGFTNFDNFNWRDQQLDETGRQNDTFHTFNLTLEQRFLRDRVGFEASYFQERLERRNRNNFVSSQANANHIRIDANVTLPDGRPNPNLGRPFVDSAQAIFNQNLIERQAMRLTAYARYDFRDLSKRWGRWLGSHSLTLLGERAQRDSLTTQSQFKYFGQYDTFDNLSPYGFNRYAKIIAYIGPSVIGKTGPVQLTPIQSPPLAEGTVANSTFFEAAASDPAQAKLVTIPYALKQALRSGNYNRDVIKSQAFNIMNYWLDDHFITNFGMRKDQDYFQQTAYEVGTTPAAFDNLLKVRRSLDEFALPDYPPFVAGKTVKSYSGVLRWPQKILRLPAGIDASLFTNVSENFTPNGSQTDAYGTVLPSPQGKTREFGVNLTFLENRFSLRLNHYETKIKDSNIGRIAALSATINNAVLQTIGAWASELNRNPDASRLADIDLMMAAFPGDYKKVVQFQYTGSVATQNFALTTVQLPSYSDTADLVAKGTEADIIYNPTRNWRILLNVTKNETVQTNIAPITRELRARLDPVFKTLANRPRLGSSTGYTYPRDANGNVTSLDAGAGEGTLGAYVFSDIDVPLRTTLAAEGVSSPEIRKYRANLVTNYTFDREGFLKGFGVGTGVRWQDKVGIGYPTSYTTDGSVFIDRAHPYYGPAETNVDVFASYTRKVFRNKIDWKIQLNVRNAIGDGDLIPITVQPDGKPASVRLPPDRRWYLTNTFSF